MNLNPYLAPLLSSFYSLYSRTYRVHIINDQFFRTIPPNRSPYIFAHWHSDDLSMLGPHRNKGHYILVSQSRDGDLLAHAMLHLGYHVIRGSSTRGGARGLLQLIHAVRQGHDTVVTVDGPTGPPRIVKPGIITLARKTATPILPLGSFAPHRLVFTKSWSKTFLPAPFSQVRIQYGSPIPPPPSDSDVDMEMCRLQVEESLLAIHKDLELKQGKS